MKLLRKLATQKAVSVMINDVNVYVEPDSGADVNTMDEHQFKAFAHRTKETYHFCPVIVV